MSLFHLFINAVMHLLLLLSFVTVDVTVCRAANPLLFQFLFQLLQLFQWLLLLLPVHAGTAVVAVLAIIAVIAVAGICLLLL